MVTALVRKELRESVAVVAVAMLLGIFFFGNLVGLPMAPWSYAGQVQTVPFVSDGLQMAIAMVGGALAIVLGLKQSAWESVTDAYYFLLHRPIDRRTIFWLKIATGVALTLMVPSLFVLTYALWASSPGTHDAPFRLSMTLPAVRAVAVLPIVYLGAFASGVRPARWFGTKLGPLVVSAFVALGVAVIPWWQLALPCGLLIACLLLFTAMSDIASRDF